MSCTILSMAKLLHLQRMWQMRCQLGTIRWACFAGRCRLGSMPICLVQWRPWTTWSAVSKWERKQCSMLSLSSCAFWRQLQLAPIFSYQLCTVDLSLVDEFGTATTIPCYVALWRRSLSYGGVNECQTCFSSRRVCSGFDRNDMYHPRTTSGCGAPEWSLRTTIYLSTVLFQTETHFRRTSTKRYNWVECSAPSTWVLLSPLTPRAQGCSDMRRWVSPSSAMCGRQSVRWKNVARVRCHDTEVFMLLVCLDVEEPACRQVPCADGALGWSGTQHQPDVHYTRLQMSSVAWNARLNWLRHFILPIQQRHCQSLKLDTSPVSFMSSGRKTPCNGTFYRLDCHTFFCALYGQKPGKPMAEARYNMYTNTKAKPRLRNFPPNSTNLLLMCNVLIIVMEQHLTLTLTSDHINNVRIPEVRFVQKDGVAHESNFIIKKSYDSPFTGVAILDLDELQEFPKISSWATLWQPCGSAHLISSLWSISNYVICITIESRIYSGRKVTFDLDFDLGSHT